MERNHQAAPPLRTRGFYVSREYEAKTALNKTRAHPISRTRPYKTQQVFHSRALCAGRQPNVNHLEEEIEVGLERAVGRTERQGGIDRNLRLAHQIHMTPPGRVPGAIPRRGIEHRRYLGDAQVAELGAPRLRVLEPQCFHR